MSGRSLQSICRSRCCCCSRLWGAQDLTCKRAFVVGVRCAILSAAHRHRSETLPRKPRTVDRDDTVRSSVLIFSAHRLPGNMRGLLAASYILLGSALVRALPGQTTGPPTQEHFNTPSEARRHPYGFWDSPITPDWMVRQVCEVPRTLSAQYTRSC